MTAHSSYAVGLTACPLAFSKATFQAAYSDWDLVDSQNPVYPADKTLAFLFTHFKGEPEGGQVANDFKTGATHKIVEGQVVGAPEGQSDDPARLWIQLVDGQRGYLLRSRIVEARTGIRKDPTLEEFEAPFPWVKVDLGSEVLTALRSNHLHDVALFMRFPNGRTKVIQGTLVFNPANPGNSRPVVIGGGSRQVVPIESIHAMRVRANIEAFR